MADLYGSEAFGPQRNASKGTKANPLLLPSGSASAKHMAACDIAAFFRKEYALKRPVINAFGKSDE
ncbi:MAG: hypothetical protein KF843_07595 [Flavobacteriales bacterium]|nr:hypothetical protein [Flavobacteriales bacterium]